MLTNFRRMIKGSWTDLKMHCRHNKDVFIFVSVSVSIGLVLALQGLNPSENLLFQGNMLVLIQNGQFNIFFYLLKSFLFLLVLYAALIFCRHHFIFVIANLILMMFFIRLIFTQLFLSFLFDGFLGFVFFLLYWLPILIFSFFCYFNILCKIFCCMGYDKRKLRPLCCPSGRTYIDILYKAFLIHSIPILIYTLIISLTFSLVF